MIARITWSPDGRVLASSSLDKTIRLWNAELEGLPPGECEVLLDSAALLFLEHHVCFRETDPLSSRSYLVFPNLIETSGG